MELDAGNGADCLEAPPTLLYGYGGGGIVKRLRQKASRVNEMQKMICNGESVERRSVTVMHKARERGKDTTRKRHHKKGAPFLRL
jgi:hypothetical protein